MSEYFWSIATHLEPRLRHFRWPGINFVAEAAVKRIEPHVLAGDKFNEANADASTLHCCITDSFELHDDELGTDDGGSNFKDFLTKRNEND